MKSNVMTKTTFNGIHIDLADISMISQLDKRQGEWIASIVWRHTGQGMSLKMATIKDRFAIIAPESAAAEEKEARENYERLVSEWKACA